MKTTRYISDLGPHEEVAQNEKTGIGPFRKLDLGQIWDLRVLGSERASLSKTNRQIF